MVQNWSDIPEAVRRPIVMRIADQTPYGSVKWDRRWASSALISPPTWTGEIPGIGTCRAIKERGTGYLWYWIGDEGPFFFAAVPPVVRRHVTPGRKYVGCNFFGIHDE